MIDRIKFICKLIAFSIALGLIGTFVYFYIIRTINSTKKYAYDITELNMQSAVSTYFLSNHELLNPKFSKKVSLKELIIGEYLNEKSIASECSSDKSYVIGTVDDDKKVSYQVCLICEGYKSDSCS